MDISNLKNIIVLKNLPSNLIEEAIVVLKHNVDVKAYNKVNNGKIKENSKGNDYVVNEAQMHIAEYISKLNNQNLRSNNKELERRYMKLKILNRVLMVLSVLGIIVNIIK